MQRTIEGRKEEMFRRRACVGVDDAEEPPGVLLEHLADTERTVERTGDVRGHAAAGERRISQGRERGKGRVLVRV